MSAFFVAIVSFFFFLPAPSYLLGPSSNSGCVKCSDAAFGRVVAGAGGPLVLGNAPFGTLGGGGGRAAGGALAAGGPLVFGNALFGTLGAGGPLVFCLLYTSPSPRDRTRSRMPSSA